MNRWLLKLNAEKCEVVLYGRKIKIDAHYMLENNVLGRGELQGSGC